MNPTLQKFFRRMERARLESRWYHRWMDRFSAVETDVLTRYHHVRSLNSQPGGFEDQSYHYESPNAAETLKFMAQFDSCRLLLALLVPPDGRIALPLDMQRCLQHAKLKWEALQGPPERRKPGSNFSVTVLGKQVRNVEEYIQTAWETAARTSVSFFCDDFESIGTFIVWDIDPEKGGEVLYDIGAKDPSFQFKELHQGIPCSEKKFLGHDDFSGARDFLASQTEFCQRRGVYNAVWQRVILCQGLSYASIKQCPTFAPTAEKGGEATARNIPFLAFDNKDDPVSMATDLHLSDKCRGGSELANPYSDPHSPFHIAFFERRGSWDPEEIAAMKRSKSKMGELYSRPPEASDESGSGPQSAQNLIFRRSSFTVLSTCRRTEVGKEPHSLKNSDFYWTMLVMSPPQFFRTSDEEGLQGDLDVSHRSRQFAEFLCIISALRKVERQWQWFDNYIANLISENFMDPTSYTRLLFDDATFSRSRLYFWIFGCLNEFDVIIDDNIKQLSLYRRARIEPMLDSAAPAGSSPPKPSQKVSDNSPTESSENAAEASSQDDTEDAGAPLVIEKELARPREPDKEARLEPILNTTIHVESSPTSSTNPSQKVSDWLSTEPSENVAKTPSQGASEDAAAQFDIEKDLARLRELDKEAKNIQQSLENLKAHFKVTQTKVQALRDGLFNASALMETRASRQLGLNVQLLTYVSIFYLPLAFCAALWAIPNIGDTNTLRPFVTTAVLVGLVTYAAVFNLENIAGLLGKAWFRQRDRALRDMQRDGGKFWGPMRQRFNKFPPDETQKTPSEWWIFWYSIGWVFRLRFLRGDDKGESV